MGTNTQDVVRSWLTGRAAADAQMRSAAAQRELDPGEPQEQDADKDAIGVLGREHLRVRALLKQLAAVPSHKAGGTAADLATRKRLVELITARLTRHESAEELLLWPAVRDVLPDGDAWAAKAREQEEQGSNTLAALGKLEPDTDDFDEHVEQLVAQVRKHVAFEAQVFALLREAMPARQRKRLGKRLLAATEQQAGQRQAGQQQASPEQEI